MFVVFHKLSSLIPLSSWDLLRGPHFAQGIMHDGDSNAPLFIFRLTSHLMVKGLGQSNNGNLII